MTGTLYGVGLGPGDPELLTLRAHRLISTARVISYPAPDTGPSFARAIAAPYFPDGVREIPIVIPMRESRFPAKEIYDRAAQEIAELLDTGTDVISLCEGDPFFYGSYMYVFERLSARYPTVIVPGVTSLTACAAALRRPLTGRTDVLTVIPATLSDAEIRARIEAAQSVAIMKVGRHVGRLRALLDDLGLTHRAGYVERASLPDERVMPLAALAAERAPYFSMILIYKGDEAWTLPPSSSF
ncbi:precorrin-2 C(20)-methyltransferase [Polymorphum gilvum]|uniref:Precorrin-2 C(20)-methyltransferase (CobI) n=1 Tax=Polymorphum gilvum (strain LMG 25793 / CGMCC 1.9160 / SL003B-26A1) TaxID=991905 RepID=F2J5F2_POLGS|nr:precorrin-2 C(20)-methyltransferase [Polymorphum gilvum]ADZ72322.1 Precorrin-2 C(20)-methyltransferase (CobI) [Polymorphum gilvum SL003B-26A1]